MKTLLVAGSLNADLVLPVGRLPLPGETMPARGITVGPGGKGANQAAAAARLGCPVRMVGQVGDDAHAVMLRARLAAAGADTAGVATVPGPTGQAVILLQDGGENSILLIGGANRAWTAMPEPDLAGVGAVLLQREIPAAVNLVIARRAHAAGIPVVLDAGGDAGPLEPGLAPLLAVLSPNETELAQLTGLPVEDDAEVEAAARRLLADGVACVLVKLGARGAMLIRPGMPVLRQAAFRVSVVDTTGAGDCCTAAWTAGLIAGLDDAARLRRACAAAACCVTRPGALDAMPSAAEVDALLQER